MSAASLAGTHSRTTANAPASWTSYASCKICSAAFSFFPWTLNPPKAFTDWGVIPICATTGIPESVMALICSFTAAPPSSFTALAPVSFINLPAFTTASYTEGWYDMNGISITTNVCFTPLTTAAPWWIISSIVTESVSLYPNIVFPNESPTRIIFIPEASISFAVE